MEGAGTQVFVLHSILAPNNVNKIFQDKYCNSCISLITFTLGW